MAIDTLRVNGNEVGWGSLVLKCNGEEFYGFTAIKYGDKRERGLTYGAGRSQAPRARTPGKYTPGDSSITAWRSSAKKLIAYLASQAPDGVSYGDTVFQAHLEYIEGDETNEVDLVDCVVTGLDESDDEGSDGLKTEIAIQPMYIKRNGLTLFNNSDGTR